ncbi:UDP-N-acetylglucosamine transporter isoform X2 [Hydra vulgaris]|uniref:UDP-N-acetylglucosamine transporter isoform X2 n=1 Tax=Hydra vulgaris TaxID=6087 RepID=A0ABM4C709_HYDVU
MNAKLLDSPVNTTFLPPLYRSFSKMFSLKYLSLGVLIFQNSILVLLLRYTRTAISPGELVYLASTAVLLAEILKIVICIFFLLRDAFWSIKRFLYSVHSEAIVNWKDSLKLLVPAALYVIQNNLLYLAITNLDAATYQVTYQLKILTTAIFSVLLLNSKLNVMKWFSLVILMLGVVIVQSAKSTSSSSVHSGSQFIGLFAVLSACISSGFSGVYFEKILKGSSTSLWMRNLQLAFFSIIFAFAGIVLNDLKPVLENGFFQGYNRFVWLSVVIQGLGGLLIGAVVKYADNILKGFATSLSIVASSLASYYIFNDFEPSGYFFCGASFVLLATYLYSLPAPPEITKN